MCDGNEEERSGKGWWEWHAPYHGGGDAHDDEDKPGLAHAAHSEQVLVVLVAVARIRARAAGGAVLQVCTTSALFVDTIAAPHPLLPRVLESRAGDAVRTAVRRMKPAVRGIGRADEKQRETPHSSAVHAQRCVCLVREKQTPQRYPHFHVLQSSR